MKKITALVIISGMILSAGAQTKVSWVTTSQTEQWKVQKTLTATEASGNVDATINTGDTLQSIEGFGTCFNELGWTSLSMLKASDREGIFKELFAPGTGAGFTICRMPVGANDFSRKWYSYNEKDGDFDMKHFSITNDLQTLIPFIKTARRYNPSLKLWASPWSPPSWMKYNHHYAARSFPKGNMSLVYDEYGMDFTGLDNGLTPDREGKEGTDMFIQEDKYLRAYALYFSKFVEAYRKQGIRISMVMPQNEFNSAQVFPSCTWTASGLARFIGFLGPQMKQQAVEVFFGTMERPNEKLVDTILTDVRSDGYVKGLGFQWAGKDAIAGLHKRYPGLRYYQTEQECGNGKNDWKYCVYTWGLMKHYISSGANAYMYWNTSLKQGGISTWGWKQNSLISVDTVNKTFKYNYEYYLMKHLSHFVKPGAKYVSTAGEFNDLLAFINPDKSIAVIVYNKDVAERMVKIKVGAKMISALLKADSFNTFLVKQN